MPLIPRLYIHQDAAEFLCRQRTSAHDESVPLNAGKLHIDMGSDDDYDDVSSASSASDISSVSSESSLESLHLNTDDDASDDRDPFVSPLGTASPPDNSLFYSKHEVHSFGKTIMNVESAVGEAQAAAKKTIKGAEQVVKQTGKVARKTVKQTGKVAKKTVKQTRKVAKKTGKAAKKTAKGAEKVVMQTANATVALPHEQSAHWPNLSMLILLKALLPVFLSLLIPLTIRHSVDEGLSHNRWFLYATHGLVTQPFLVAPFVATCHYAMPEAEIPLRLRGLALAVGVAAGMGILAFIGEILNIFPIPFSFIITMLVGSASSVLTLRCLTPKCNDPVFGDEIRTKFNLCCGLLLSYMISLVAACLWGVEFQALYDRPWLQSAWVLFYQVMEFIFKIGIGANITTRLNPERWLQLNLVVDLIFAYVQLALLPFFANWVSVTTSVVSMMLSMFWRVYSGVDRLQQFLPKAKEVITSADGPIAGVVGIGELVVDMTVAQVKDINAINTVEYGAMYGHAEWALAVDPEEVIAENKEIERSETEETQSTSDSESVKSDETKEKIAEPKIDRRAALRKMKYKRTRNRDLEEVSEKQRHLYHIVDPVSSAVILAVVRLSAILTFLFVRYLPGATDHVNASFQISDEQWRAVVGYAAVFLAGVVSVVAGVGVYIRHGAKNLGGLTLNRLIAWMFRDSFWFIFLWLACFQFFGNGVIFNHFGADFSLQFGWVNCKGQMEWPLCVMPTAPEV